MSKFPPEVFGQIALDLSTRDLWSLSLVSRVTFDEANRLLYRTVDFSSLPLNILVRDPVLKQEQDKPINSFFRTVSKSPRLTSFVKVFAFRTPYQPDSDVDPALALRALINLRQLSVTSILSSDQFPSFLHDCTLNLRELHAEFPLDADLLKFLTSRPSIQVLSCGREKIASQITMETDLRILPLLKHLSVVEGAFHLVPHCPALTHLTLRTSERQPLTDILPALAPIGPHLVNLDWHHSLFYGTHALVQILPQLAAHTPHLETLRLTERFCGGWGREPCEAYVEDTAALDLTGTWLALEEMEMDSWLSCHNHLLYWDGPALCGRIFQTLPSLTKLQYAEDGRAESDVGKKMVYARGAAGILGCTS